MTEPRQPEREPIEKQLTGNQSGRDLDFDYTQGQQHVDRYAREPATENDPRGSGTGQTREKND